MNTETAIKPRRQIRGQEVWAQFIGAQPGSGLSVEAYCRLHKLSPSGFYTWRQRLQKKRMPKPKSMPRIKQVTQPTLAPAALVALGTLSTASSPDWEVEIDLGAGMVLRLRKR